jgi:hypothetical protein
MIKIHPAHVAVSMGDDYNLELVNMELLISYAFWNTSENYKSILIFISKIENETKNIFLFI